MLEEEYSSFMASWSDWRPMKVQGHMKSTTHFTTMADITVFGTINRQIGIVWRLIRMNVGSELSMRQFRN
jgi:hypothetical protein